MSAPGLGVCVGSAYSAASNIAPKPPIFDGM
jgi:hypothetical protein